MGRVTFRLPDIGEGIAEAEIVAWHVAIGDQVEEDAPLADMMTDKATVEMAAPVSGKVLELAGAVGDNVAIGSALVVFETEDGASDQAEAGETASPLGDGPAAEESIAFPGEGRGPVAGGELAGDGASSPEPSQLGPSVRRGTEEKRILASPAVRARAKDLGVDLAHVHSAQGDRVRHSDLDAFLKYQGSASAPAKRAAPPDATEEVRIVGLRRRIAENMAEAKRNIPHFTYVEELDVTALEALRAAMNEDRAARPKLTLLPFLIKAIARALANFPMVNARYDDVAGVVSRHASVHLGMATQTEAGLMVPVLRDAQALNVWQLAGEIERLAAAARSGKAARDELSGSTITLTSLGALGGIVSTPVINRPEVAIVGVNRIVERPAVVAGRIEVRKLMNLSSSFDHRVVDGMDAARFIQAVKRLVETPALLFMA